MTEHWRYSLPSVQGEGWAVVFLDSTGTLAIVSDYGNAAYRWAMAGMPENTTFKEFITRLAVVDSPHDYLVNKLSVGRREYDPERTLYRVKQAISIARREQRLTSWEARQFWDEVVDDYGGLEYEATATRWFEETAFPDANIYLSVKPCTDATLIVRHVIPRLQKLLRDEIAATTH